VVRFDTADEALRAAIFRRFAALSDDYAPLRCWTPPKYKIIFDTEADARGAAREMTKLDDVPRYVHSCDNHWHTTRTGPAGASRDVSERKENLVGHLARKIKAASQAAKDGNQSTAWTTLQQGRGGDRCRGCGKKWSKMSKAETIAHAECDDEDGCPDT
jgi:hypothetical protein